MIEKHFTFERYVENHLVLGVCLVRFKSGKSQSILGCRCLLPLSTLG